MLSAGKRLVAATCLLLAGCASTSLWSGLKNPFGRNSPGDDVASRSANRGAASSQSRARERSSPFTTVGGESSTREQRLAGLIEAAERSERTRDLDAAKSTYERILLIDPLHPKANYRLAVIADGERRFADAERHYQILLNQSPHDADLLASLGASYRHQGRFDDSERTMREALKYDPRNRAALSNLGWLVGTRGDYAAALAMFRAAGTEEEARKAMAELFPQGPDGPAAARPAPAEGAAKSGAILADQRGANGRPPSRQISAPTPRVPTGVNSRSAEGSRPAPADRETPWKAPADADEIDRWFAHLDSEAAGSPTRANQPHRTEDEMRAPPAVAPAAGTQSSSGTPPDAVRPVAFETPGEAPGRGDYPLIRPSGSRVDGATATGQSRFEIPRRDNRGMDAAAAGSASRRGEALPDWPQGSVGEDAARRSGGAVGPAAPLAERKHLEAQAEAARLALNAGPTGALFPIVHGPPAPSQPSLAAATSGDDRPSGAAGLARTDSADAASRPAASPTIPTPGAAAPKIESPPAPGERKRGIATLWLDEPGFDEPPRR